MFLIYQHGLYVPFMLLCMFPYHCAHIGSLFVHLSNRRATPNAHGCESVNSVAKIIMCPGSRVACCAFSRMIKSAGCDARICESHVDVSGLFCDHELASANLLTFDLTSFVPILIV